MSYPKFKDMPIFTRVRALRDITEKNRTMKAGETGRIVIRHAYVVGVVPDGKKLAIETGCENDLEVIEIE